MPVTAFCKYVIRCVSVIRVLLCTRQKKLFFHSWYFNGLPLKIWIVRGGNLIECLLVEFCQYGAVFEVHVKELISSKGLLKLSFDIGSNTLKIWSEYVKFGSGFRSAEGSACGQNDEIDGAMGTLSVNVFEQMVCWTPHGLSGSMPTVLTYDCGWNWVKLPGKILFSVILNSSPLFSCKEGKIENCLKIGLKIVWVLAWTFRDLIKIFHCVSQFKWLFFLEEIKIWALWVFSTVIFDRTGIHQVGIMCSMVFGTTRAHWLKRLHLKQFLGDISRKFGKCVFWLKMIIMVFLRGMVLHFILPACEIKLRYWIIVCFRRLVVYCEMINSRDCCIPESKTIGSLCDGRLRFASLLSEYFASVFINVNWSE